MIHDRSRRFLVAIFSLVAVGIMSLAGGMSTAFAQSPTEPTAFKNVRIWVNPEYDDPRLLVMVEGQLVGASAPVTVRFLVPTTAEMYSAGSMDAQGKYSGGPPDRQTSTISGWDEISYQLKTDTFRVEYYDSIGTTLDKLFTYEFMRLYPIQNLTVIVQKPKQTTTFAVDPTGTSGIDGEGFSIQTSNYTDLDTATPVKFDISYTRTTSEPSLATSPGAGTTSGSNSSTSLIVVVVIVAAVLGGGGVYLFTRSNRNSRPSTRASRRRAGAPARTKASATPPVFCSQCGRKVDRAGRFCPACGAEL